MRDRSGSDAHGRNESDCGDLTFAPGLLLTYTDENHGKDKLKGGRGKDRCRGGPGKDKLRSCGRRRRG